MPMIPCLDCGTLVDKDQARRGGRRKRGYGRCARCAGLRPYVTNAETDRRKQTVEAWRAEHGDWCPGWECPPHPATDLTADHVVPVVVSRNESSQLSVLCRSCNSRKQANI